MQTLFTIAFATHRLEALAAEYVEMARHQAIVLEEPPTPVFLEVLRGDKPVEDYLYESETEFPEFSRRQVANLQELWQQGKVILQLEPYLERLLQIHELLAEGEAPAAVEARPDLGQVYRLERQATGALLAFYRLAWQADFATVVAAVKQFAQADAARFRLRDRLRAQALAALAGQYTSIYVEAGYLHLALPGELRRQLSQGAQIRTHYLLAAAAARQGWHFLPFGPGDSLTLAYIFDRPLQPEAEDLLAARSLVYIKLLSKDEEPAGEAPFPHLQEEILLNHLIRHLDYEDCARLYPMLRGASPARAWQLVHRFLRAKGWTGAR